MEQYKLIKYPKGTTIFKNGDKPKDYFYIITRGKIASYNAFCEGYTIMYNDGNIVGLMQAITGESYYSNMETVENTELWQIQIENISKINNKHLIRKISNHLSFILETWLSKYYSIITKNKINLYNKEDILTLAKIYKKNDFEDASYKLCSNYIKLYEEAYDIKAVKKFMQNIGHSKKPTIVEENCYKMNKGYCLYSELEGTGKIYYIKSGKVGIYTVLDSKLIARAIYTAGYILNGGNPVLEYKPLLTTAIAIEDSVIEILNPEDLIKRLYNDVENRIQYIKMSSIKIINVVLKIKALNKISIKDKLIVLIYAILKIETLFTKQESVKSSYKIEDITNMLHVEIDPKEAYLILEKIKYVELDTYKNITVYNVEKFFKEYESYTL